jgi:ABC-type nitrate/sulfonate/bicarbonate transport system substrate-binding protein
MMTVSPPVLGGDPPALRVGFLALTDAAPLVVAREHGFFAKHGLRVELKREVGWATIREKIIYGELDAAQCPAPMLWSTRLGLDSVACPVLTGLVLNLQGDAITLSEKLWQSGVRDSLTLREEARRRKGERKLTFGVVFNFSFHHLLLRSWLRSAGLDPESDVRIVVVPPAQMFRNLAAGTIDGYCVGEPWNSLAVREKVGWCPTWSGALQPNHVEKVLMVTERFAEHRASEHRALIAAVAEACAWCDDPAHRDELVQLLAGPHCINQAARVIAVALSGEFDCGHDRIESVPNFITFHRDNANAPTLEKALIVQRELVRSGLLAASVAASLPTELIFREDIFRQAVRQPTTHELVS